MWYIDTTNLSGTSLTISSSLMIYDNEFDFSKNDADHRGSCRSANNCKRIFLLLTRKGMKHCHGFCKIMRKSLSMFYCFKDMLKRLLMCHDLRFPIRSANDPRKIDIISSGKSITSNRCRRGHPSALGRICRQMCCARR